MNEPSIERVESAALAWPSRADALEITDQVTYDIAVDLLAKINRLEDFIKRHHKPIKEATHKAHKEAVAAEMRLLDPVAKARAILRNRVAAWEVEQERLRKIEEERLAQEAEAEEAERRQADANTAVALGASIETVKEILSTPSIMPRPVAPATFERAGGISLRQSYRAEVTDMVALCRAIGAGEVSPLLVEPNQTALNARARSEKETLTIPGVRVVRVAGITDRR